VVRNVNGFVAFKVPESLADGSIDAHNSHNAPVDRPRACNAPQAKFGGQLPAQAGAHGLSGDGATT
jgi:hypothetical protein